MDAFKTYVDRNRERFIAELQDFCRQPSVAAQNLGMREMAQKVLARLQRLGANARLIEVKDGAPVVYGEIGAGKRTLMIYDHYDVQPPEPLELWDSPPWQAAIRDGKVFARGVADNKSELVGRIQAIEAYLATVGSLPLKIKFVIEGEEEIGSVHLPQFASENRALLEGVDGCLWEFGGKDINERPTLSCGLKGIVYVELHAHGAKRDLHSALAAIVVDPAWRLTWALATLKDANDRILIDDFMSHVRAPTAAEMEALETIPFDEEKTKDDFGIPEFINHLGGIELLRKYLYEPTCTICGLYSGYIGEGSKTVLPNHAFAKIDFRLVPNLSPDLVLDLLKKHLARRGFDDIEVKLTEPGEEVARSALDSAIVRAAIAAAKAVYPQEPVIYPTSAGSGPMYPLCQALGIPVVSAGCGWHDSRAHAPNENIRIEDYFEGMSFIRELIDRFATA
ncbi:MAG: M20/M25/M40 family metallo-hydrolase [Chloroflexota bacterium]|nr:M20/M25/M40 family metallo-hydrolase [Chloroflexota bacterium]